MTDHAAITVEKLRTYPTDKPLPDDIVRSAVHKRGIKGGIPAPDAGAKP